MIVRSLLLRHGRVALPKPSTHIRAWRRFVSSDIERKESPFTAQALADSINSQRTPGTTTNNSLAEAGAVTDKVAQDWNFFQHQKAVSENVGATMGRHYRPHELLSNPPRPKDITLELLLASQSHLGHATSLWHPANAKYIFGIRGVEDPIHIISLDVTAAHLRRACKVVQGVTERGGLVLFVGTRSGQARTVVRAAQMAQGCHLFTRWIPGSITNGQQILGRCQKKVVDEHDVEVEGFAEQLNQLPAVKPDLVVCLNPLENYVLLRECGLNNIPTIGIVDTDVNPTWVTYPIPANDDSLRCVQVVAGVLGRAGQEGQRIRLENAKNGVVEYRQAHGLREVTAADKAALAQAARDKAQAQALLFNEEEDLALAQETESTQDETMPVDIKNVDSSLLAESPSTAQDESFQPYERDSPLPENAEKK
ncbi:Hypothetical protein R9X50_00701600 [Acrodontium crateriforme]|uniref:Ribosomal protein S2 n=1 Tax=Acrodontium crateriforme TaxID=150365 RepID=A0AAQ3R785_9PEZI|nr:Hypothetical protein R9X50_00701600 [Acrodontium crateriforme]